LKGKPHVISKKKKKKSIFSNLDLDGGGGAASRQSILSVRAYRLTGFHQRTLKVANYDPEFRSSGRVHDNPNTRPLGLAIGRFSNKT